MRYLKILLDRILNRDWHLIKNYICLSVIIGTAIWLRFFMISNQSLWIDEGLTLMRTDGDSLQEVIIHLKQQPYDKYQPIYFFLLFWWRSVFGDTEFALRSLSALLESGVVIVIYLTALKLYGKNHAFWSLMIVSFSSFSVYYSQEARPYALLMFLASLQLNFFCQIITKKKFYKGFSIWGFWLVTFVGICSSIFINIFTIALGLSDLLVYRSLRRWLKIWIPLCILGIPVVLFLIISLTATELNISIVNHVGLSIFENTIFVLYGILAGTTFGPSLSELRDPDKIEVLLGYLPQFLILLVVVILIFVPLLFGLVRCKTASKNKQIDLLFISLILISLFLGFVFAAITRLNWVPRHSSYLLIPFVLIIPSALNPEYQIDLRYPLFFSWTRLAILVLVILNIYSLNNYYFDRSYWKDDYRSAAQYLLKNNNSSTKSVLLWGKPRIFEYYGYLQIIDGRGQKLNKQNLAQEVNDLTTDIDTVFLVLNRDFYWLPSSNFSIKQAMSNLYTLKSKVSFSYFEIYQFIKKI